MAAKSAPYRGAMWAHEQWFLGQDKYGAQMTF